jgi:two-component system, cell cycle sensor histidine kinase and response regulator CckA
MQRPARLLIVEDERLIAQALQGRVSRLGYTVVALAASGPEAIQQALAYRPDLVLMDIRLQGTMDGIEAVAVIHTHFELPVVYLSASVDAMTLGRADATHPAGFLHKPVSDQDLQHTLARALQKVPRPRRSSRATGSVVLYALASLPIPVHNPTALARTCCRPAMLAGQGT